jgi:hypothetical protein
MLIAAVRLLLGDCDDVGANRHLCRGIFVLGGQNAPIARHVNSTNYGRPLGSGNRIPASPGPSLKAAHESARELYKCGRAVEQLLAQDTPL